MILVRLSGLLVAHIIQLEITFQTIYMTLEETWISSLVEL